MSNEKPISSSEINQQSGISPGERLAILETKVDTLHKEKEKILERLNKIEDNPVVKGGLLVPILISIIAAIAIAIDKLT